jgi:hypothetical protein
MTFKISSPRDISYVNLATLVRKHGSVVVTEQLKKSIKNKEIAPGAFDLSMLARAYLQEKFQRMSLGESEMILREESIDSSQFNTINREILSARVMEGYGEVDGGVFDQLCTTVPSKLKREFIPGISMPTDNAFEITEGMPFPESNVNEDYVQTNTTKHFGLMLKLTFSAVFFDRTNLLLKQAKQMGEGLAYFKLQNLLRYVLGIHTVAGGKVPFSWKGQTYDIFQASTPWVNTKTTNALVDYTDIELAALAASVNNDPNTGRPIMFRPKVLLVPTALEMTAKRIVNSTLVRFGDGASASVGTEFANPISDMKLQIVVSEVAKRLLDDEGGLTATQADGTWFLGDPKKAFAWIQNWPYRELQLADGSDLKFERDVWYGYRGDERGEGACLEPRHWVKCSA